MRAFHSTFLAIAVISCTSTPAARPHDSDSIEGRWHGVARAFGAEGPLTLDFVREGDSLVALTTMHIEALWLDRTLVNVRYDDPRVHFEFPSRDGNGVFDGLRSGDTIAGETRKNGRALPMVFHRVSRVVPKPPYHREVVRFQSEDGTGLEGVVTTPVARGTHPAVVFIHGSGAGTREDFYYLADRFARGGFVSFSYDKRGSGQSGGNLYFTSYQQLAADARAAVRTLAQRANVDGLRIGIAGISEGGWVAPLVAASSADSIAFVIAIVASGGTYFQNGIFQNLARMERYGASEEAKARYRNLIERVSEVTRRGTMSNEVRQTLQAELAAAHREGWATVTDLPRSVPAGRELQRLRWTMMDFDPAPHWKRVRAPVLLVLGADDRNVNSAESATRIASALRAGGNDALTTVVYSRVEHNLMTVPDTVTGFQFPAPPAGYPDTLVSWATRMVRAQR